MNTIRTRLANCRGLSLPEILVALALTSIVTLASFKAYITQHKNYLTQDDITIIQQNVRASMDELSRQLRMAGFALPHGLDGITAYNTNPDTIVIQYADSDCSTFLSAAMPQPSAELKCGSPVDCFYAGQWVYIFEPDSGGGEFFEITHVQTGSDHLQHNTMTLSKKYTAKSVILSMNRMKFYVDNTTDPAHPALMVQYLGMAPQVYAENITDLQFRYGLDNGTTVDVPIEYDDVRSITVTVAGRSNQPEKDNAGIDRFRTRTNTSTVSLRNKGV